MPKPTLVAGQTNDQLIEAEQRRGQSGASVETVLPKPRRRFGAAEKLRILEAADAAEASGVRGAVGALLRREAIYASQLATWRRELRLRGRDGMEPQRSGRKPKHSEETRTLIEANATIAKLERELTMANLVIELQKKAHELLRIALPRLDGSSS